jgi:glycosyltransferase involved in cell wall biosynthesis
VSHVLSTYPLSLPYRTALEQKHGSALSYLTLSGLRSLSPFAMVRQLFSLKGAELQIAIEDESSRALLPILGLLASITRVSSLVVLDGTHERTRLSRWQAALWVLHLCWESLAATFSMAIANAQLGRLKHQSRIDAPIGAGRKVGYLNCNLWFGVKAGGSVGHISGVVNALTQLGHDVDFYTVGGRLMVNDDARYVRLAPPKILALPYEKTLYRFDAACTRQIESEFRRSLPSFIYQRMSIGNFTGVKLSRKFGLPLIIEYNGSEVWVARNWGRPLRHEREASAAEEACLRHAHLIVTISDVLADELIARGVERERIVVYPNCIDPAMFDPAAFSPEEVAELRRSVGLEPRHTVATFVGTFGQWHGADVLARTIASMVRTHKELFNMGLRFLLVGDGAKMPEVRQILSPSEVSPYVTLTGLVPQHEAPRYLAASDLVLAPHVANADGSKFFGSPTKLFEYLAMARGIVASDLDQLGQVLRPAVLVNGKGEVDATDAERALAVLVPPGDVSALSEGIALLVRDLDLRRTLGENARSVALSRYTWKHHVEAILAGLEQVSKSKSGQPPT